MLVTNGILREATLDIFKTRSTTNGLVQPFQLDDLFRELAKVGQQQGWKTTEGHDAWSPNRTGGLSLFPNLRISVSNIVWDLVVEGIIRPGTPFSENFALPFVHLTTFGEQVVQGSTVSPYATDAFMHDLKRRVPSLDPVIEKYVAEAVETLRRNCLLSSTVTLGCASEKAFLQLSETYSVALEASRAVRYRALVDTTRGVKQHHQVFKDDLKHFRERLKSDFNTDWLTNLDLCLDHLFTLFRDMRNAAGHPSGFAFTKEMVHSHLVVFPQYLSVIQSLADWCNRNRPLS